MLSYKRSHFATQLPVDFRYSPSHAWMSRQAERRWRVGLTKFATRMLGEIVDHGFQIDVGTPVEPGQIVGFVEGFKAISDLYCVATGQFLGGNPALKERPDLVNEDPFGAGWLYEIDGEPDPRSFDVHGYRGVLDQAIDKILERRQDDRGNSEG